MPEDDVPPEEPEKKKQPGKAARSAIDGLTAQERRIVKARLGAPTATPLQLIELANVSGASASARVASLKKTLQKPVVIDAIKNPPETVTGEASATRDVDFADLNASRAWLLKKLKQVVDNKASPQGARIQAMDRIQELLFGKTPPPPPRPGEIRSIADVVRAAGRGPGKDDEGLTEH